MKIYIHCFFSFKKKDSEIRALKGITITTKWKHMEQDAGVIISLIAVDSTGDRLINYV